MVAIPSSLRERRLFVDSAAYLALLDDSDEHHANSIVILNRIAEQRLRPYTSNAVIIESHALILSALGIKAASQFLHDIAESNTVIVRVRATDEERAKQIIYQYDDKDFSFTDALSFVLMERLGIRQAFSFDRHFEQYGFLVLA